MWKAVRARLALAAPFAHPPNARRRDPRLVEYLPVPAPTTSAASACAATPAPTPTACMSAGCTPHPMPHPAVQGGPCLPPPRLLLRPRRARPAPAHPHAGGRVGAPCHAAVRPQPELRAAPDRTPQRAPCSAPAPTARPLAWARDRRTPRPGRPLRGLVPRRGPPRGAAGSPPRALSMDAGAWATEAPAPRPDRRPAPARARRPAVARGADAASRLLTPRPPRSPAPKRCRPSLGRPRASPACRAGPRHAEPFRGPAGGAPGLAAGRGAAAHEQRGGAQAGPGAAPPQP